MPEMLLKTTDRFFNLAASPEPLLSYIRVHVFPYIAGVAFSLDAVKKFVFPRISQIAIQYRDSSLSDHRGDSGFEVKSGDRMPYLLVDGKSVYERLHDSKFHLVSFSDGLVEESPAELDGEFASLLTRHQLPLYPHIAEAFGTTESFSVLLRPDNYVAKVSEGVSSCAGRGVFEKVFMKRFLILAIVLLSACGFAAGQTPSPTPTPAPVDDKQKRRTGESSERPGYRTRLSIANS
jgi:hypothetical protein